MINSKWAAYERHFPFPSVYRAAVGG